jgi:sugar phosphate isomerase/epimerase
MEEYIKKKLEERNDRIIKAIINKAENVCPGAIALIGIAGSFHSGDIYEKSDLDLCIFINDESAWKVASCFILEDVAFDIYCTPWSKLEEMSEYNNPYITKLLELDIVYCDDDKYIQKYMDLRSKVISKLNQPYSLEYSEKVEKFVNEACKEYANIMLSSSYGECRYATAGMLYYIEFAIYMCNKTFIKRGIKRIPEEISTMKYLPVDFNTLYCRLIRTVNVKETREISTTLMKAVKEFVKQMKDRVITKKEISEADIKGSYEEIYSNWKNKMHHAANREDVYLSLMTASSCQQFYDYMYSKYNVDRIDLMKSITPCNLTLSAEKFDNAMEEYKKNYERLSLEIKYYEDLDEFERKYLDKKAMQIGCLARYFNPYEEEVVFAKNNNFEFMQIWYDRNGISLKKDLNPIEIIKKCNFPTIIHAVLDINEFEEHVPKLTAILKYLGHNELIIHPICESEEINPKTIYKLSEEVGFALKELEKENITLYLENNSRLDPIFNEANEIEIIFSANPKLQFLLDVAHIDNYEHLKAMIKIKMPKILHIADRDLKKVHEHLPIGQGNIDYKYIFTNVLNGFEGKIILEIVQNSKDIINSRAKIEEYCRGI